MPSIKNIANLIKNFSSFVIVSHILPDGDSLGSSVALYSCLQNMGKDVSNLVEDETPHIYKFLDKTDEMISPGEMKSCEDIDCLIFLDCTDEKRGGENAFSLFNKIPVTINIDHHISNTHFADYNFVDYEASATGELIYYLILELSNNQKHSITPEIATALYTAIVTDTGNFKYDNTDSSTFKVAHELVKYGVDISKVRINVWENKSMASIKCLSEVLATLEVSTSGKVSWVCVTKDIIDKYGVDLGDLEDMINYPKSLEGVEIAIIFKEVSEGVFRIGLRSKEFVNVSKLAATFNGGGHEKAAGFILKGNIDNIIEKVTKKAENFYHVSLQN